MSKLVEIVKIERLIPLYKKEELATSVELATFKDLGFEIVVQKGLYKEGYQAIYIKPDSCLLNNDLFKEIIKPNGDEKKSYLGKIEGKPSRVRAKKFSLSKEPNGESVYSNGILLPMEEVHKFLETKEKFKNSIIYTWILTDEKELGVYKYIEPEEKKIGQTAGKFPENIYKTDEENILNWIKKIEFPLHLIGSEKIDGSSCTILVSDKYPDGLICSRNLSKKIYIEYERKPKGLWEKILSFFGKKFIDKKLNENSFVEYGLPYLNKIKELGFNNIALRGEINGGNMKGSGNKNNPASKLPINIKFFGTDSIKNGVAVKDNYYDYLAKCSQLGLERPKEVFNRIFESKEDLMNTCKEYFKSNMIEGIIVRSEDSKISYKIMNDEYDSKK